MKCVICHRQTDQQACQPCQTMMGRQLDDLLRFYELARGELIPGNGGGEGESGTLRVAAVKGVHTELHAAR